LVPIFAFKYIPTQDGPHHLANAIILKDYRLPGTRYHEFFELQWEPIPNWMTHLSLAWLMRLFPPLMSEKILVSAYLLGFAWSFRYYLGAFGKGALSLAPAVFLFLYNRCLLMGFYNYCLSLVPFWLVLGYCVRRGARFAWRESLVLLGLSLVAYFSHLLGYGLACASALWITLTTPPRGPKKFFWLSCSLLPTSSLALWSLVHPNLLGLREVAPAWEVTANRWLSGLIDTVISSMMSINQSLFASYDTRYSLLGFTALLLYELLVIATVLDPGHPDLRTPGRRRVVVLGLVIFGVYLAVPDFLSPAVGFMKARLALIAPLVWLAALRMPGEVRARRIAQAVLSLALLVNLYFVLNHFASRNSEIAEYAAGMDRVGHNRTLFVASPFVLPSLQSLLVNHLEHAADYYCLTTRNVNLDNFQASMRHFPVRYRDGVARAIGDFAVYPNQDSVDVLLSWRIKQDPDRLGRGLTRIFRSGSLEIYGEPSPSPPRFPAKDEPQRGRPIPIPRPHPGA